MIHNEEHFSTFGKWLPELRQDEVYFLSLSARNKYLSDEEREQYGFGRTEMFARNTARDKAGIRYVMAKLEATLSYRKTRAGKDMPRHALVVYMNVNPSSLIKAYGTFTAQMDKILQETLLAELNNTGSPPFDPIKRMETHLMNAVQKSTGRRHLVDIDVDTKERWVYDEMAQHFQDCGISYMSIETRGGFHFLLKKDTFPKERKINFNAQCKDVEKRCGAEVCINSNAMVPVPGTHQGGHLVRVVDIK